MRVNVEFIILQVSFCVLGVGKVPKFTHSVDTFGTADNTPEPLEFLGISQP